MRDSQRSAVYAWERALEERFPHLKTKMSLEECGELIARVWEDHRPGQTPPQLGDGRRRRTACGSRHSICLPRWARHPSVVLHEVAHGLAAFVAPGPAHGPGFARVFLDLLAHYAKIPANEARALAVHQKPRRVRFAPVAAARQDRTTREWRAWKAKIDEAQRQYLALKNSEPPKFGRSRS